MMRRVLIRTAPVLLVALALLVACAPGEDVAEEASGGSGDTITVWSWRTEDVAGYNKMFDAFEEETGIKAEFKPYKNTEYDTILETSLKGGKGPDVMQLRAYGALQTLIDGGYLVPLDDQVAGLDDFSAQALDGARGVKDGKIYGVPFAIQTLQIYYNKQIFEDNGLAEPKTYEELAAACKKLQAAGVTPIAVGGGGADFWTLPILHSVVGSEVYGGNDFVGDVIGGQEDFTSPDFVRSIEAVNELVPYFNDDPAGTAYTDSQILFTQEKAAMFIGGSWEAGYFASTNPELDFGTFPMPPRSGSGPGLVSWFTDGSYGVNAQSDNKKAAMELVNWMATEEFGQMFADELKQITPVPGVEFTDPVLEEIVADYQQAPTPYMLLVYFRYGDPTGTDLIGQGIQKMFLDRMSAAQVAQSVDKGVSQWFDPGKLDEVSTP